MALLLAKGPDITEWRGVDEFIDAYSDAAVALAAKTHPDGIAQYLELIEIELKALSLENSETTAKMAGIVSNLSASAELSGIRWMLDEFYSLAYAHYGKFRSAPALFDAANSILKSIAELLSRTAVSDSEVPVPPFALVVMGPAGRMESTRFCRIQLAMAWDGDGATEEDEAMASVAEDIVTGFRTCGIPVDESVTPLHPQWRGSLKQWEGRLDKAVDRNNPAELIEILRLVDQNILVDSGDVGSRFRGLCGNQLARHNASANLVSRCLSLSNGLGMMGGFKLHKSGPHRGRFSVLDHALLPLAATVAAICLNNDIVEDGTPRRLRELVRHSRIDVDLAERALQSWHLFCSYRLELEAGAEHGQDCRDILQLEIAGMAQSSQERLRESLETVGSLQRFLQVTFGQQG